MDAERWSIPGKSTMGKPTIIDTTTDLHPAKLEHRVVLPYPSWLIVYIKKKKRSWLIVRIRTLANKLYYDVHER